MRVIVSTVPPGRTFSRSASAASAGRALTISSALVMCWPMTAIRSITPRPACGPSSGSMTGVPPVSSSGSQLTDSMTGSPSAMKVYRVRTAGWPGSAPSRVAIAGVISARSLEDSHVPIRPAAPVSARNGDPPRRVVYQERVSRCISGLCRTYEPEPDRVSAKPSATRSRTASTPTRSETPYCRASS